MEPTKTISIPQKNGPDFQLKITDHQFQLIDFFANIEIDEHGVRWYVMNACKFQVLPFVLSKASGEEKPYPEPPNDPAILKEEIPYMGMGY